MCPSSQQAARPACSCSAQPASVGRPKTSSQVRSCATTDTLACNAICLSASVRCVVSLSLSLRFTLNAPVIILACLTQISVSAVVTGGHFVCLARAGLFVYLFARHNWLVEFRTGQRRRRDSVSESKESGAVRPVWPQSAQLLFVHDSCSSPSWSFYFALSFSICETLQLSAANCSCYKNHARGFVHARDDAIVHVF